MHNIIDRLLNYHVPSLLYDILFGDIFLRLDDTS